MGSRSSSLTFHDELRLALYHRNLESVRRLCSERGTPKRDGKPASALCFDVLSVELFVELAQRKIERPIVSLFLQVIHDEFSSKGYYRDEQVVGVAPLLVLSERCTHLGFQYLSAYLSCAVLNNHYCCTRDCFTTMGRNNLPYVVNHYKLNHLFPIVVLHSEMDAISAFLNVSCFDPANPMPLRMLVSHGMKASRRDAAAGAQWASLLVQWMCRSHYQPSIAALLLHSCSEERTRTMQRGEQQSEGGSVPQQQLSTPTMHPNTVEQVLREYCSEWSVSTQRVSSPRMTARIKTVVFALSKKEGMSDVAVNRILSFLPRV